MPQYTKTILCLAKSRRPGGACVAGREKLENGVGEWVRPVGQNGAVPVQQLTLNNHQPLRLGDIIQVTLERPQAHHHHIEDHLLNARHPMTFVRAANAEEIAAAIETNVGPLWTNGADTFHGQNDKVSGNLARAQPNSLRFIEVDDLEVSTFVEGRNFGDMRRKTRGKFSYEGAAYRLIITDLEVENLYETKSEGTYEIGRAFLCVSLPEINDDGFAYKLIASVIVPPN